ncbi:MAG: hypothetical protein H0X62_06425 [Bacteroidetes bacterium]|nr:hypothetical protein [Bacteroidota bacterium]
MVPVYMDYQELRSSVKSSPAQTLEKPGKIFYKGNYIFINEMEKGIHIINNSNPSSPQTISFINIPGNVDLAIKNNTLYADSYVDMVAIDISNPEAVKVVKRLENIFPYNDKGTFKADSTKGIVIATKEEMVTDEVPCNGGNQHIDERGFTADGGSWTSLGANVPSNQGKGGSMARLTIMQGYLYYVDDNDMHLININNETSPVYFQKVNVGVEIETIFPYENKLFIGSRTGMYIYDNSNPSNPVQLSVYSHIRNCDPVVVQGNTAYVTLRTGTACQGWTNQLDVVDVTDLRNPKALATYIMKNPHGLSIHKDVLLICDGKDGLKMFDANDPMNVTLKSHKPGFDAFDVIQLPNIAMVIGPDGLYQYSYTQNFELQQLSKIPITK